MWVNLTSELWGVAVNMISNRSCPLCCWWITVDIQDQQEAGEAETDQTREKDRAEKMAARLGREMSAFPEAWGP